MVANDDGQHLSDGSWPNPETRLVQMYLGNKTAVMLHMREAAREYFRSPYRKWNEGELLTAAADAKSFSDYVRCYVEYVTRPQSDPGHDAEATLRMRLIQLSLSRVDWKVIADSWRRAVAAECEIHCSQL